MIWGRKMEKEWITQQIASVDAEISRLKARREAFVEMLAKVSGNDPCPQSLSSETHRKRSANVKPLILNIMAEIGADGATSAEVDDRVREKVPTVANGTVAAVLSRLKGDGALAYDGIKYYDAKYAASKPQPVLRVAQ